MHNAALYIRANAMQRRDAKETIDEYASRFQWRDDGSDSLLDIGCGSGDVMMDYLLPILPGNFQRLIGADVSKEMVEFASKNNIHANVYFEYFDLDTDISKQSLYEAEPFDHITSFHCLHWQQNQDIAIKNMYELLKPNGDILLTLLAFCPIFNVYQKMSQMTKWAKYMTDVDHYISPYHFVMEPIEKLRKALTSNGFRKNTIEIREKSYNFNGIDELRSNKYFAINIDIISDRKFITILKCISRYSHQIKIKYRFHLDAVKAVNPFVDRIPEEDQDAFFDDYLEHVVKMGLAYDDINSNRERCRFYIPYQLMIAYAQR